MAVACVRRLRPVSCGMRLSPIPREAGTCISRDVAGGNEYATVVRSVRDGARVTKEDRACLGRVVDRARGACRSKARGLFPCDLATGEFGPAPEGVEGAQRPRRRHGARHVVRRRVPAELVPEIERADGLRRRVRPRRARHGAGAAGVLRAHRPRQPPRRGLVGAHLREAPLPQGSAARAPSVALWASVCPSSAGAARPTASPLTPRGHPTLAAFPSRPSATTTVRPARRSASPAPCRGTRACPPLPPRRRQRDRREHGHQDYRCARGDVCFGPRFPPQSLLLKCY